MGQEISIHAPLAGRDLHTALGKTASRPFQSTRPSRGATQICRVVINIGGISIHAPLAGRDVEINVHAPHSEQFQSTRPSRGATAWVDYNVAGICISIHAPLAGRDHLQCRPLPAHRDFNPRAPRGARLTQSSAKSVTLTFQSTRPSRGATRSRTQYTDTGPISIHAPLAGRDMT